MMLRLLLFFSLFTNPFAAYAGSAILSTGQSLTWDHPGAETYRVYVEQKMVREVRERQTPLEGLPAGKAYVTAVDGKLESGPSNVVEIGARTKPSGTITLRRPKAVAVKPIAIREITR